MLRVRSPRNTAIYPKKSGIDVLSSLFVVWRVWRVLALLCGRRVGLGFDKKTCSTQTARGAACLWPVACLWPLASGCESRRLPVWPPYALPMVRPALANGLLRKLVIRTFQDPSLNT